MKKNHEKVEVFIRNALSACGEDAVFGTTKMHLHAALKSLSEVSRKRDRNVATQKATEKATAAYKEWWDMIKKNAALNFNITDDNLDNTNPNGTL